jgi:Tfp pilus assembly protein PilZ
MATKRSGSRRGAKTHARKGSVQRLPALPIVNAKRFAKLLDDSRSRHLFYPTSRTIPAGSLVVLTVNLGRHEPPVFVRGRVTKQATDRRTKGRPGVTVKIPASEQGSVDYLLVLAKTTANRRREPRLPMNVPVNWRRVADDISWLGHLINISRKGALFETSEPVDLDEEILIQLRPPGAARSLELPARVLWKGGTTAQFGIEWRIDSRSVNLQSDSLLRFLAEHPRGELAELGAGNVTRAGSSSITHAPEGRFTSGWPASQPSTAPRPLQRSDSQHIGPAESTSRTLLVKIYVAGRVPGAAWRNGLTEALENLLEGPVMRLAGQKPDRFGSWWKELIFRTRKAAESQEVRDALEKAKTAIELAYLDGPQAAANEKQAQGASAVIAALSNIESACIQAGSLLVVKCTNDDGRSAIFARTLSPVELKRLESNQAMLQRPDDILAWLTAQATPAEVDEVAAAAAKLVRTKSRVS